MTTLKQISVSLFSAGSCGLLIWWTVTAFGFRSPLFAALVTWLVISWVAIQGQVFRFSFRDAYFETRRWERDGGIYELVGIRLFKKLVRRGPLSWLSPGFRKVQIKSDARRFDAETRQAEAGHVIAFVSTLLLVGYAMWRGWFDATGWLVLFNILLNGYPIMLQRYNRARLPQ